MMYSEFIKEEKRIVELTEEEKNEELINTIKYVKKNLSAMYSNLEQAQDELIDYYTYLIKAEEAKYGYLLKEAKNKCKPVLLEPIMKVVVVAPDEYTGGVIGDITSRRGKPLGQESRGNAVAFSAMVPLAEMFGYATSLRSNTQGRGNFTMVFDHYEEVPRNISDEIIKKNGGNN